MIYIIYGAESSMRRAKRGIHLGSHCDASCRSNILRLHAWPNETRARLVEYARLTAVALGEGSMGQVRDVPDKSCSDPEKVHDEHKIS